jgi:2,4-dienoyl-CoA reductase (NADPH2)
VKDLGKTTGWIHRASLIMKGVHHIANVTYKKISDEGFLIEVLGEERLLEVDHVVVCAGQISENRLFAALKEYHDHVYLIGGALEASELDAKRAIKEASELAATL